MALQYINKFTDQALCVLPELGTGKLKFVRATGVIKKAVKEQFSLPVEKRTYLVFKPIYSLIENGTKTVLWDMTNNTDLDKHNMVAIPTEDDILWVYATLFLSYSLDIQINIITDHVRDIKTIEDIIRVGDLIETLDKNITKEQHKTKLKNSLLFWNQMILDKFIDIDDIDGIEPEILMGMYIPKYTDDKDGLKSLTFHTVTKQENIPYSIEFGNSLQCGFHYGIANNVTVNIYQDGKEKKILPLSDTSLGIIPPNIYMMFNLGDASRYYLARATIMSMENKYPTIPDPLTKRI